MGKTYKKERAIRLTWDERPQKNYPSYEAITTEEVYPESSKSRKLSGRLITGDNLSAINHISNELSGKVKLIYIDPPFLSNVDYNHTTTLPDKKISVKAYTDKWERASYLDMLKPRIEAMHGLLTDDGFLFLHCDWRVSHLVRVLLDEIFGEENFLNEIIWNYGGRGAKAVSGQFPRNHDTIIVYGKTRKAKLKKVFTERIMTHAEAHQRGIRIDSEGRYFKTSPRGDYTDKSIKALEKEGRVHRTSG
ncbi:MAG: site-specific DNA-methyltransferase, partial [Deltaproteobacteria bacterium]|nr:site-specific DNA-methyltransferase [Deltaproteobacteria bacterium]